jgi:hypothetical protein
VGIKGTDGQGISVEEQSLPRGRCERIFAACERRWAIEKQSLPRRRCCELLKVRHASRNRAFLVGIVAEDGRTSLRVVFPSRNRAFLVGVVASPKRALAWTRRVSRNRTFLVGVVALILTAHGAIS